MGSHGWRRHTLPVLGLALLMAQARPKPAPPPVREAALMLLAHLGDGSTLRSGPFREPARNLARFLVQSLDLGGSFLGTTRRSGDLMTQAVATYALVEAYGLSSRYRTLRRHAQLALGYLTSSGRTRRLWGEAADADDAALEAKGWTALALAAARVHELTWDPRIDGVIVTWLGRPRELPEAPRARALALAVEVLARRAIASDGPAWCDADQVAVGEIVHRRKGVVQPGTLASPATFFACLAVFLGGGPEWRTWQKHLASQIPNVPPTNLVGWDPATSDADLEDVRDHALNALVLEIYYRYSRLLR